MRSFTIGTIKKITERLFDSKYFLCLLYIFLSLSHIDIMKLKIFITIILSLKNQPLRKYRIIRRPQLFTSYLTTTQWFLWSLWRHFSLTISHKFLIVFFLQFLFNQLRSHSTQYMGWDSVYLFTSEKELALDFMGKLRLKSIFFVRLPLHLNNNKKRTNYLYNNQTLIIEKLNQGNGFDRK